MVCIYCGNKTKVNNSRKQRGGLAIWRRRQCVACDAIFTTNEAADLEAAVMVETKNGNLVPFIRDKLFYSLAVSCGHRSKAIPDASGLTDTVVRSILGNNQAIVPIGTIKQTTLSTLHNFDTTAATYYKAYFGK